MKDIGKNGIAVVPMGWQGGGAGPHVISSSVEVSLVVHVLQREVS